MLQRLKVGITGPYTEGDVAINVQRAMQAGSQLLTAGHFPYVPHLSHFLHMQTPQPREVWMLLSEIWLRECDAIVRIPGVSIGADREVKVAKGLGIPIYGSVGEFLGLSMEPLVEKDWYDDNPYKEEGCS